MSDQWTDDIQPVGPPEPFGQMVKRLAAKEVGGSKDEMKLLNQYYDNTQYSHNNEVGSENWLPMREDGKNVTYSDIARLVSYQASLFQETCTLLGNAMEKANQRLVDDGQERVPAPEGNEAAIGWKHLKLVASSFLSLAGEKASISDKTKNIEHLSRAASAFNYEMPLLEEFMSQHPVTRPESSEPDSLTLAIRKLKDMLIPIAEKAQGELRQI